MVLELGQRFVDADHELSLVGGPVRDLFLGRVSPDLDFTTDATPDQTVALIRKWADNYWEIGRAFGTIGMRKAGFQIEITTYRAEAYDPDSRKPVVAFGKSLTDDLLRRDFTINAMALRLPALELVDPFGGVRDLHSSILATPGAPEDSFSDDPLRMMRAARFAAQLDFRAADDIVEAMTQMSDRISIVSAERVRDEFSKLLLSSQPSVGVRLLVSTGIAERVIPELPALILERDEHHRHKDVYEHSLIVLEQAMALEQRLGDGPDLVMRLAALLHDIGKPRTRRFQPGGLVTFYHHDVVGAKMTRKRMRAMRYSNDEIDQVAKLVELHLRFHGYGSGEWTDSAVRRYVRDAGDQLERLHILTRADCTTRNARKAARLQRTYDALEERISVLAEQEELQTIRPDLDGNQIMEILGIGPGPEIGKAYKFLLELRLENGPMSQDDARAALVAWHAESSSE
ncbi:MAG: CCA tRNA nucleotidyltransferase [Aeromicrobium sp.]